MKHLLGGLQWAVFLMASSIATPIAIAAGFGMDQLETMLFVQRTMFVLGVACLVQAFIGHRLPINEGPAGLWWGIFMIYASFVGVIYPSKEATMQSLQSGLLYSGLLFLLFAYTGLIDKMKNWFTPTVTFTYLMLLVLQLSGTFLKAMTGTTEAGAHFDGATLFLSIVVIIITFYFMHHRLEWMSRYSIVLAIITGWLLFIVFQKANPISFSLDTFISFPNVLVYGPPLWDSGMFMTALFLTVLLITNMIASIRVMDALFKRAFSIKKETREKEGAIASGINQLIAGFFSAIGPVPISAAAGFVSATRLVSLRPFIIGSVFVIIVSFFPLLMSLLAALPAPVANAVTFAIFTRLFILALQELLRETNQQRAFFVAALGLMSGVGIMFLPVESLGQLSGAFVSFFSNGLIAGTCIAIAVEQWLLHKNKKEAAK